MVKKLIDMARDTGATPDSQIPFTVGAPPISEPQYDHGLHVAFNHDTLLKLDLDTDVEVGDMLEMRCMAKVTSVSKHDTGDGEKCRVELVLSHIGLEDEEDEESEEDGDDDCEY